MKEVLVMVPAERVVEPRGAVWAAAIYQAVRDWLRREGERRGQRALLEVARSVEISQPAFASELRAAALADQDRRRFLTERKVGS